MPTILDRSILEAHFGGWPHFHDAEVDAARLRSGRRVGGPPTLELDIYVLAKSVITADGARESGPVVATLRFDDISAVELGDFNHQNVLFDLVIQDMAPSESDPRSMRVELQSSWGLTGAFRCARVAVLAAEPINLDQSGAAS